MYKRQDKVFSGFGAELAAMIGGEMFRYLDGPVERVGSTSVSYTHLDVYKRQISTYCCNVSRLNNKFTVYVKIRNKNA